MNIDRNTVSRMGAAWCDQPLSPAELGDVVGGVRVADSPADEAAQTRVAGQSANAGSSSTG